MISLTKKQMVAFEAAMKTGDDLFITGGAGTGKSFIIELIKNNKEAQGLNVAVCAFTGIAAKNIGGVTIHRLFGLGIGPVIDKIPDPPSVLASIDVIIIDEISMLRCDVFEYIIRVVEKARQEFEKAIQLIVVGDFYQLPPILRKDRGERAVLREYYESDNLGKLYAFQSPMWQFKSIELDEIVRQDNPEFSRALNMIRTGDSFALPWIDTHKSGNPVDNAPFGVSTNREAKEINEAKMKELDASTERRYRMTISGSVNEDDYRPYVQELVVRDGMMVMILVNDSLDNPQFVNGSMGIVLSSTDKAVTVKLLKIGKVFTFSNAENPVFEYAIDQHGELERSIVGVFWQIPIKPCYALTVHKMQGLTLDALNLTPANWEDGLLYTALSRVKDVGHLYYEGKLSDLPISCNKDVADFYADPDNYVYSW